jgi:hypothetical protein
LTSFPVTLAGIEPGRKQVLIVEDWAEIRRLRRSEGVSISEIARVVGEFHAHPNAAEMMMQLGLMPG